MSTINMSEDELFRLKRLILRTRKGASDIEKLPDKVLDRAGYRETIKNIYQQLHDFVTKYPEYRNDFNDLGTGVGGGNPMEFEGDFKRLRTFVDVLEDSIIIGNPTQPPAQFIILPGQAFTASKILESILQQATNNIKIIDNYLSEDSVKMLETANNLRNISIITKQPESKFISAIGTAQKGWKGVIEVRESPNFHDRYLIIDDASVWMCGPSIDYLGIKKPGVIVKIEETTVTQIIIGLFNNIWQSANKII